MSLVKAIRSDETYKKFQLILKRSKSGLSVDEYIKELEGLHLGRNTRGLIHAKKINSQTVAEAILKDQSYRSRAVEILMMATKVYNLVYASREDLVKYVLLNYNEHLSFRAKADKENQVRSLKSLRTATYMCSQYETLIEIAQILIEDIDKAAWAMSNTVKALDIGTDNEFSL